ncbi:hypothetical protein ACKGJO_12725 [Gracilimonas sp. Q87]|uniref:hypothetical protein n=1 Tax=Gracilimonas sp. Q87 TaxID=3384766 RepID=UPI00398409C4
MIRSKGRAHLNNLISRPSVFFPVQGEKQRGVVNTGNQAIACPAHPPPGFAYSQLGTSFKGGISVVGFKLYIVILNPVYQDEEPEHA